MNWLSLLTRGDSHLLIFRWLVVVCQGATLLITWPLWQVHRSPPMLPALPLPHFDMGIILLCSLIFIIVRPLPGIMLHTLLTVYAVLIDQTRLQPEIVSLILLMWGTLPNPNAKAVGRAHLIALWTWAGLNKLLSPAFLTHTGPGLFAVLLPQALISLRVAGGYLIAFTELATGILAIFPRTRKLAGLVAFGLHAGILLTLSPVGRNWNEAVWPWNLTLAFAGIGLIMPWRESLPVTMTWLSHPIAILFLLILLLPAGWFVGLTDAYLAHHLYSSDVPRASSSAWRGISHWRAFKVPLPPEHRLFEQYFRLTCQADDTLVIRDSRWWFRWRGLGVRQLECPMAS